MKSPLFFYVVTIALFNLTSAEVLEEKSAKILHHEQHRSLISVRASENHQCDWVCVPNSSNSTNSLNVIYNGTASLLAIQVKSSNVAIIFDYSIELIALLNGQTGEIIITNITTNVSYKLKSSQSNQNITWNSSRTTFESYFQSLESLQAIYRSAEQQGDRIDNIEDLRDLLKQFNSQLTTKETWGLILKFGKDLNNNLKLIYQGNGSFQSSNSFRWFLNVNIAFTTVLNNAGSNLKSPHLDLNTIFNQHSGVEALLELLTQIGSQTNFGEEFSSFLGSPDIVIKLLQELSAGSNNGLDGLISILVNIVEVLNGTGSVNKVISSIINYNPESGEDDLTLSQLADRFLKLIESQSKSFQNGTQIEPFVRFLRNLNSQNFVFNNVNISDIIKLLRSYNPRDAISTIVKVLSTFLPSRGIPQFINFILNLLNNTNSIGGLSRLIPGMDLSNLTSGNGSILERALQGSNLTQLVSSGCPFVSALTRVPIFGQIFSRISSAVGDGFNITNFLNSSSIFNEFRNVLGVQNWLNFFNGSGIISTFEHGAEGVVHGIENGIGDFMNLIPGIGGGSGGNAQTSGSGGESNGFSGFGDNLNISGGFDGWFRNKHKPGRIINKGDSQERRSQRSSSSNVK